MAPCAAHFSCMARDAAHFTSVALGRSLAACLVGLLAAIAAPPIALSGESRANESVGASDDAVPYQSGVVAVYKAGDGVEFARLEDEIAFAWGNRAPDRRMPAGPFEATFRGRLFVQTPGVHALRVFSAGAVRLEVAGRKLLDASLREPGWMAAEPLELEFGFHPIVLRYTRTDERGRLALYWQGPGFELEPLGGRWLLHDAAGAPPNDFGDGEALVRSLRCAACHAIGGEPPPIAAPALDRVAGNLSRDWMVERLSDSPAASVPSRKMPRFALDRSEAAAIADYLLAASDATPPAKIEPAVAEVSQERKNKKDQTEPAQREVPDASRGDRLFRSVGCLGCHQVGTLGRDGPFGGGDLSAVAAKRPGEFFARWLTEPAATNRDHRMPIFALTSDEIGHLSAYLQSLKPPTVEVASEPPADTERGRLLVRKLRCGACHALAGSDAGQGFEGRVPLDPATVSRAEVTCLEAPDAASGRPGYRLDDEQQQAVAALLRGVEGIERAAARDGADVLRERNCVACHARGREPGLAARVADVAEADAALVLPSLVPPSLASVGDKLNDESLAAAINRSQPPVYTWLAVRMPRFGLSEEETRALVRHFVDTDRIPARTGAHAVAPPEAGDATIEAAGARLVTAGGFGCTSCHAIGKWTPQKVAPGAEGADLSQLGRRIRRQWFDRWVRNPARIVAQMEMPAVVQPVRGVLGEDVEAQLAAVWHVLDQPGFTPPAPDALRVVRRANLSDVVERAAVLTDVIEVDGRAFVKPLVIGLANRHNVLFDLATGRLAAWWTGDTARQQTRGKIWFWEGGAGQFLSQQPFESGHIPSELTLVRDGKRHAPTRSGQFTTEFDYFEHIAGGVRFGYRLRFDVGGDDVVVRVHQDFIAPPGKSSASASGFRRRVQIDPLNEAVEFELEVLPGDVMIDRRARMIRSPAGKSRIEVSVRTPPTAVVGAGTRGVVVIGASAERAVVCEIDYRSAAPADQFAPVPAVEFTVERQELAVVPGFDAVRLPTSARAMPTGLAWRADGTLVVSSLEGRVWLARDTDGDELEDELTPFSDELAAPYGVAASGEAIDALNKYGLLRLVDRDGDGQSDRTETVASGWGHTRDYHDWAIGLPRDGDGNYYVGLPCQQDDRSEEASRLRGQAIKLVPREPTDDDPRRFAIEPLCGGLRFPNGVALSPEGELFTTDNQGNYNPFNELNHIVVGARYGFINRREKKPDFKPPARAAAIEIPHPWTRSVNGICFLQTPASIAATGGEKLFGPFEGHLVGCEYDTRRLVRMSLQRVGGEYQGAVYPMSREPDEGEATFEGPLVCQVAPDGDLYIGNIRDSGWGAGANTGSLVRMRMRGELPCGIAEVRAQPNGFAIELTAPVDRRRASDPAAYQVSSFRRISTPAYGGDDQDRRVERIRSVTLSPDGCLATLDIDDLREGFVYEFHLANLAGEAMFFPAEAYYTLRRKAAE